MNIRWIRNRSPVKGELRHACCERDDNRRWLPLCGAHPIENSLSAKGAKMVSLRGGFCMACRQKAIVLQERR